MARLAVLNLFWTRLNYVFREHLAIWASKNVWKNNNCVDDFWQ